MRLGTALKRPPRIAAVAAAALTVAAAGCGGGSSKQAASPTTAATTAPPPTQTQAAPATAKADFTVTEREYSIAPGNLHVPKPGTFTLSVRNTGSIPHALAVEGAGGSVRTAAIAPGQTAQLTVTLTQPGRYAWYCPIDGHKGRGMVGSVIVAGAPGSGGKSKKGAGSAGKKGSKGRSGGGQASGSGSGAGKEYPAPKGGGPSGGDFTNGGAYPK